ncbi:MAG: hypothetical protein HXY25_13075 [Alphaproteobacteria bacterium]|nr:hypothetical protein [Alphaproteobacteria bacterium]
MADQSRGGPYPEGMFGATRQLWMANPMQMMSGTQLAEFWRTQDRLLEAFEDLAQSWCERRRDAARQAVEAANELPEDARDVPQTLRMMNEWMAESVSRLAEDAREGYAFYVRCAEQVANGASSATEAAEMVSDRVRAKAEQGVSNLSEGSGRSKKNGSSRKK